MREDIAKETLQGLRDGYEVALIVEDTVDAERYRRWLVEHGATKKHIERLALVSCHVPGAVRRLCGRWFDHVRVDVRDYDTIVAAFARKRP